MQYSTFLDSPNARLMILLTRKSHCLSVAKCVSTSCLFFTNILTLWLWLHIKSSHPSHNECSEKKLISERNMTCPNPTLACLSLVNSLHCIVLTSAHLRIPSEHCLIPAGLVAAQQVGAQPVETGQVPALPVPRHRPVEAGHQLPGHPPHTEIRSSHRSRQIMQVQDWDLIGRGK